MRANTPMPAAVRNSVTPSQIAAIERNGNVLVLAGAGTGKTRTLVERCVVRLLDPDNPAKLTEMLLVTFTDAAAAEMKRRIRQRLEEELSQSSTMRARIQDELAFLDRADICTLHSFCLRMVRNHFHELQLDPQLTVLTDVQRRLLMEETLDALLKKHFAGGSPFSSDVQGLLHLYGQGAEGSIHDLLLNVYEYTQTRVNPGVWLKAQQALYGTEQPEQWQAWFAEAFQQWRARWIPRLRSQPAANFRAHGFARLLQQSSAEPKIVLTTISTEDSDWEGTKGKFRNPIREFFDEAAFLNSLLDDQGEATPLREDWNWVRRPMRTLVELVSEFTQAFSQRKGVEGFVDFTDFEQFALRLLWGADGQTLTPLAEQYRRQLKWVLVDECQDINPSQDAILRALSAENRFLVGDVKQSIYRFRLADPRIFQGYQKQWARQDAGSVIALSENFRSREGLLAFVNSMFETLMQAEIGGVAYDADARLRFSEVAQRRPLSIGEPAVEFHLALKTNEVEDPENGDDPAAMVEVTDTEREARIVASRAAELRDSKFQVWNKEANCFEDVAWKHIVILLRAPSHKAETYARVFYEAGIPLQAQGSGFYDNAEILDLTNLLEFLNNPFNDVPTLAVLRSPLVGLTLNELAEIRIANKKDPFWMALKRWHEVADRNSPTFAKVDRFLAQFGRWRQMGREMTISQRLEGIIDETHYFEWLLTQDRASQRRANVERFLALAQQFDPLQRVGLQRFLRFIQMQHEGELEREPRPVDHPNAVRFMSIHQSKGLEFPVVIVPDLAKQFNLQELKGQVLIDDQLGLCPKVQPPDVNGRYPSLAHWMAAQRQKPELLGEELRLLYVAFTRAQERLILIGTATPKRAYETWPERAPRAGEEHFLISARSCLDWLGPMLCGHAADTWADSRQGEAKLFTWKTYRPAETAQFRREPELSRVADPAPLDAPAFGQLARKLEWQYPHQAAITVSAKQNATVLARVARHQTSDEAQQLFSFAPRSSISEQIRRRSQGGALSAAALGIAHHRFLHLLDFRAAKTLKALTTEADRIEAGGFLTPEERQGLDLGAILAFWQSPLGLKVLAHVRDVHREIPFTARCSPSELKGMGISLDPALGDQEFFIVRGMVDLAVILEKAIWIIDFKTDSLIATDVARATQTYAPQLKLYALALSRIYRRPVAEAWLHFFAVGETVRT